MEKFIQCNYKNIEKFLLTEDRLSMIPYDFNIPSPHLPAQSDNPNTRKRYKICSKLTIKTPKRHQWRHTGFLIANFDHILQLALMFLLLTLNM